MCVRLLILLSFLAESLLGCGSRVSTTNSRAQSSGASNDGTAQNDSKMPVDNTKDTSKKNPAGDDQASPAQMITGSFLTSCQWTDVNTHVNCLLTAKTGASAPDAKNIHIVLTDPKTGKNLSESAYDMAINDSGHGISIVVTFKNPVSVVDVKISQTNTQANGSGTGSGSGIGSSNASLIGYVTSKAILPMSPDQANTSVSQLVTVDQSSGTQTVASFDSNTNQETIVTTEPQLDGSQKVTTTFFDNKGKATTTVVNVPADALGTGMGTGTGSGMGTGTGTGSGMGTGTGSGMGTGTGSGMGTGTGSGSAVASGVNSGNGVTAFSGSDFQGDSYKIALGDTATLVDSRSNPISITSMQIPSGLAVEICFPAEGSTCVSLSGDATNMRALAINRLITVRPYASPSLVTLFANDSWTGESGTLGVGSYSLVSFPSNLGGIVAGIHVGSGLTVTSCTIPTAPASCTDVPQDSIGVMVTPVIPVRLIKIISNHSTTATIR